MRLRVCISLVNFSFPCGTYFSILFYFLIYLFFALILYKCYFVNNFHSNFAVIFSVQKPREQVADAEALLDITNTLMTSVKAHGASGVTPSDFVSCLLREFGQQGSSIDGSISSTFWKDVGLAVSHVFRKAPGCRTM